MTDIFSKEKRSLIMSNITGKNTEPELAVRKTLREMGQRYRLHAKKLPGAPDIVFPARKKLIFVNGCFWHGHKNCSRAKRPSTNTAFWNAKIDSNRRRDTKNKRLLSRLGWDVLTIWACQTKNMDKVRKNLSRFLY